MRNHLEQNFEIRGSEFIDYEKIEITPYQVHKSKREHALAVFKLSKGIANILLNNNGSGFEKIGNRLDQMSERFMTQKEKEKMTKPSCFFSDDNISMTL